MWYFLQLLESCIWPALTVKYINLFSFWRPSDPSYRRDGMLLYHLWTSTATCGDDNGYQYLGRCLIKGYFWCCRMWYCNTESDGVIYKTPSSNLGYILTHFSLWSSYLTFNPAEVYSIASQTSQGCSEFSLEQECIPVRATKGKYEDKAFCSHLGLKTPVSTAELCDRIAVMVCWVPRKEKLVEKCQAQILIVAVAFNCQYSKYPPQRRTSTAECAYCFWGSNPLSASLLAAVWVSDTEETAWTSLGCFGMSTVQGTGDVWL